MIESTTIDGGSGNNSGSGNDNTTNNANNNNNVNNIDNNANNNVIDINNANNNANNNNANNNNANNNNNNVIDHQCLETAKWTKYLPESFGIRESVRSSSYRWCVRESGMWGIATATAMSLHRLRMGSKPIIAGHTFFGTFMIVMLPSYYFCYRRREHQENVIEMMMKYNQFGHAQELPDEPPIDEHPFWGKKEYENNNNNNKKQDTLQHQFDNNNNDTTQHDREFRGLIKERKEWQKQIKNEPTSFDEIFHETTKTNNNTKKEIGSKEVE